MPRPLPAPERVAFPPRAVTLTRSGVTATLMRDSAGTMVGTTVLGGTTTTWTITEVSDKAARHLVALALADRALDRNGRRRDAVLYASASR